MGGPYDVYTEHTTWNCLLRRVELLDDATVSGTDRFDVRVRPGTSSTSAGGVFGPDKRLTIKATGIFGVVSLPIDVGAITIADGGIFRPESPTSVSIPGGVTLDNGILHGYSTTFPETVPFNVTERGGTLDAQSGTTTIKGSLSVPENTTLTLQGSATMVYSGAVTNNGVIAMTAGTHQFTGATLAGDCAFNVSGGSLWLSTGTKAEHMTVSNSAGTFYLNDNVTFDTLDLSNNFFGIYTRSATGPTFNEINLETNSGSFDVLPQQNGMADVKGRINVNKTGGTMFVYGPNNTAEHGMALELHGFVSEACIGVDGSRAGTLELKPGSDIKFNVLRIGHHNSSPSAGRIIVDPGAKLVAETLNLGEWSGTPNSAQTHKLNVGGELESLNRQIYVGQLLPVLPQESGR